MYVRVVRFTDADPERVAELVRSIEESDGPPPGVAMAAMKFVVDESARTALSIQEYETAADMAAAAKVFDAMDASETPGTRASVDECELKLELSA